MGVEIGGIIEEMHEDEEGRRIIDKVKIEYLSLIWDELSDEALEEFEKLVGESMPPMEDRVKLYPDYVEHPPAWELTFLDRLQHYTFHDWIDWLMGR